MPRSGGNSKAHSPSAATEAGSDYETDSRYDNIQNEDGESEDKRGLPIGDKPYYTEQQCDQSAWAGGNHA